MKIIIYDSRNTNISLSDILKEYSVSKLSNDEIQSTEGCITHNYKEGSLVSKSMYNNKIQAVMGLQLKFSKCSGIKYAPFS